MSQPSPQSFIDQAVIKAHAGDLAGAEALIDECLALDPSNVRALLNLGVLLRTRNALAEAEDVLRRALALVSSFETASALALVLKQAEKLDEAENIYLQILKTHPGHAPTLAELGELYDKKGDKPLALRFHREAWMAEPTDLAAGLRYAQRVAGQDVGEAARMMDELLRLPGLSNAKTRTILGSLLLFKEFHERRRRGMMPYHAMSLDEMFFKFASSDFAAFRECAFAAVRDSPSDVKAMTDAMVGHFCARAYGDAEAYLKRLRQAAPGQVWDSLSFDLSFHRDLEAQDDASLFGALPLVTDVVTPAFANENVIYLSCSLGYFGSFGAPLLRSLSDRGPGEQVQVHLMDASEDQVTAVRNFCAGISNLTIGISLEQPGFTTPSSGKARAYYHAIRFIRYFQHLRRHRQNLWMMDVDALVNRPPNELYRMLGPSDAAFRARAGRFEPWNQFSAGIVGARATPAALRYFRAVAAYIAHFKSQGKLCWGIDQAAMYAAFVYLQDRGAAPTLSFLTDRAMDLEFREDGILWCSAGTKKFNILNPEAIPDETTPEGRYHARFNSYARP